MHKVSQLEQPLVWNNFPGLSKFLKNGDKNEKVSEKILNTNSFTPITFQGCQVSLIWHDTHAFRAFLMLSRICRPSVTNGGNSKLYARSCPNSVLLIVFEIAVQSFGPFLHIFYLKTDQRNSFLQNYTFLNLRDIIFIYFSTVINHLNL